MDNGNKINLKDKDDSLHEEVMLFLGDEVNRIHQEAANNSYNIEEEYAKTKKNHSPYNFLVLFGAFVVVIATVFFVNKYITLKDQEIKVSLDEFEDLNLNNLLNTVAAAQVNYDEALKAKLILETEYETKLNDYKTSYENEIYVLDSLNLSNRSEYNRRKSKLSADYNNKVEELKKEYDGRILLAQKQVDAYKAQLNEFDSVKVANAQEKEKLLNSERQLKQLEIDKLKKSYESQIQNLELAMKNMRSDSSSDMREAVHNVATRYQAEIDTLDPKLNDTKANEIIAASPETADFEGAVQLDNARIHEEKVVESINEYQALYDDYKYLDDVIKSIPQKHSIPDYVSATRNLVNNMSQTYVDTSVGYYQDIVAKRQEIDNLNQFIEDQKLHYENVMENAKNATSSYLSAIFKSLQVDAIILAIDENQSVQIAVSPEAKEIITKDGIPARIKVDMKYEGAGESIDSTETTGVPELPEEAEAPEVLPSGAAIESGSGNYISGTIVPDINGSFYFEIGPDENGNPLPIDYSILKSGTGIEIVREIMN